MSAAAARDTAATFEHHRLEVYRWAARAVGRHDDALDITQDVGLRWLLQCRRVCPDQPRGWLRRATLNRAMDCLRSRQSACHTSHLSFDDQLAAATVDDPLERAELHQRVARSLATLSDMQREVLVAKLWDGLTFEKIAGELGIAVPTAKTHYIRALAAIRDQLGDEFAEP